MRTLNATLNMRKFTGIRKSVNYLGIIYAVTIYNVTSYNTNIGNNFFLVLVLRQISVSF